MAFSFVSIWKLFVFYTEHAFFRVRVSCTCSSSKCVGVFKIINWKCPSKPINMKFFVVVTCLLKSFLNCFCSFSESFSWFQWAFKQAFRANFHFIQGGELVFMLRNEIKQKFLIATDYLCGNLVNSIQPYPSTSVTCERLDRKRHVLKFVFLWNRLFMGCYVQNTNLPLCCSWSAVDYWILTLAYDRRASLSI